MVKRFACGVVVPGCSAVFEGDSDDSLVLQVAAHAWIAHGMETVPPNVVAAVRSHITTVA